MSGTWIQEEIGDLGNIPCFVNIPLKGRREKMTKEKAVQFTMDGSAYNVLKSRAKILGISTGQLVENLLGSLELRLERAYDESTIKSEDICLKSDRMMIEAILKADQTGDSDNWKYHPLQIELYNISQEILLDKVEKYPWRPEVKLNNK